ncbi:uncharacterized protein N7459_006479 [Penicillium hispanicum]|uniref:uncharacterized protein n=1 Tax=Penicillium hispanicum TaxID=1080232 RepID=UPI002541D90E|nr:uncharacterized protein N7459_006479 [Penicillium hispanicum]KAJ5577515.1 hypothetical protein N7459_006479 [Penicillium hispanicum]
MPKKGQAKRDETDWNLFIQQEDPEVNADHAESTLNTVKHIDRNFKLPLTLAQEYNSQSY